MKPRFWDGSEEPMSNVEEGKPSYVTLSAPGVASAAAPLPPAVLGTVVWYLSHSTQERWRGKRNVRLRREHATRKGEDVKTKYEWSWQEMDREEVQRVRIDFDGHEPHCTVLGSGKEGSLGDWMTETVYGIEDTSGEIRGDWRSLWVGLYYSPANGFPPAGVEILSTRLRVDKGTGKKYVAKPETIEHIKNAFTAMETDTSKSLVSALFEVSVDEERDEDELPKVHQEGIWSPEDDEVEATKRDCWKCAVQ